MRFSYAGTEDETVQRCFLQPNRRFVGFVQKVPGGFRYRQNELALWSMRTPLKHEAARALAMLGDGAFDISPE